MIIHHITEYLHDADPGILRIYAGAALLYCMIGAALIATRFFRHRR